MPGATCSASDVAHMNAWQGVKGMSAWCVVFQRDDEQRILDCSRILDVQRATPDERHFTIKFGPRVTLKTCKFALI